LLRSTFTLAQQYRYSGAIRDDFAANNAVARAAREKYGEVPQDVLEGLRRSRFAPPIVRRSALDSNAQPVPSGSAAEEADALTGSTTPEPDNTTEEIADEDAPT